MSVETLVHDQTEPGIDARVRKFADESHLGVYSANWLRELRDHIDAELLPVADRDAAAESAQPTNGRDRIPFIRARGARFPGGTFNQIDEDETSEGVGLADLCVITAELAALPGPDLASVLLAFEAIEDHHGSPSIADAASVDANKERNVRAVAALVRRFDAESVMRFRVALRKQIARLADRDDAEGPADIVEGLEAGLDPAENMDLARPENPSPSIEPDDMARIIAKIEHDAALSGYNAEALRALVAHVQQKLIPAADESAAWQKQADATGEAASRLEALGGDPVKVLNDAAEAIKAAP